MKKDKLIVIDCHYLCHKDHYALSNSKMTHDEIETWVIYGFMNDLLRLRTEFGVDDTYVFCWDTVSMGVRERLFPFYKSSRRKRREEETTEEKAKRQQLQNQIAILRSDMLKDIGYANILSEKGLEGDDLIASVCKWNANTYRPAIIVSSDKDLYQCLSPCVSMYDIKKRSLYTLEHFQEEYRIHPDKWPIVKCLAGCSSDDVPGIEGIGEVTALKYLREEKLTNDKRQKIENGLETARGYWPLVKLPYKGTPIFNILPDSVTEKTWNAVLSRYGIKKIPYTPGFTKPRPKLLED